MHNPSTAHQQDVLSRLWKVCFDDEIKMYCVQIRKAKRNNEPIVRNFAEFLDESIQYHEFLDEHFKVTIEKHFAHNISEVNEGVRQCCEEVALVGRFDTCGKAWSRWIGFQ